MVRLFINLYLILFVPIALYVAVGPFLQSTVLRDMMVRDMSDDYIGGFHLVDELYHRLDEQDFEEVVSTYPESANFEMSVFNIQQAGANSEILGQLGDREIYIEDLDDSILYYRVSNSDQIVQFGPMKTYAPLEKVSERYDNFFIPSTILAVLLAAWSIYRKLQRLDKASTRLGEGDFSYRVSEKGKHRIGNLNHSFNKMAQHIENLLKGHKSLTNAVAHELRTPVARMRFQLDMLYESNDEEQRNEYIHGISDDLTELGELVDELLTFARFDREIKAEDIPSHSLHDSLQNVLKARNFSSNIKVNYDKKWFADDLNLQILPFEPKYLERAIGNLVSNAQKYAQSEVQISVKRSDKICTIVIDDDGPGIPKEDREGLFEPFKRLDNSRTRSTGGYGLGLAIVKQIVQWHDGRVEISQSPLGGARFSFSWPLTKDIEF